MSTPKQPGRLPTPPRPIPHAGLRLVALTVILVLVGHCVACVRALPAEPPIVVVYPRARCVPAQPDAGARLYVDMQEGEP